MGAGKGAKIMPPAVVPDTTSPAALQEASVLQGIGEFELPRTTLIKLAKGSDMVGELKKQLPDNVKMQQDVNTALMRSSTVFINYLAAHDQAYSRSGKIVTAHDVLKAIVDMDMGPADQLLPILEQELAAYRALNQKKKKDKA